MALAAVTTLLGYALTLGLLIPTVVIPVIGAVVAVAMVLVMLASATLFFGIIDQLRRFEVCRGAATNSVASDIALVLAVLNFVGVLIAVGVTGTQAAGGAPCTGPRC
jgi:hypothetical protein